MKKFILMLVATMFVALGANAQINDGQLPGTRWRVVLPISTSYQSDGSGKHSVTAAPQLMFKQDLTKWLAIEAVANYNINTETFSPKIWLGFHFGNFYFMERNNYNCKTTDFSAGLAATYKFTKNWGADMTWDNIYANKEWCEGDRLQFVGSYATDNKRWNFNAGYSCRFKKGFIANIRYNIANGIRLQGKLDCGAKNVTAQFIWDFN